MDDKKNKKVMSIAIEPELHESVKEYAKRKGTSASSYIGELVKKALKINIDDEPMVIGKPMDEDVSCIVLKIPSNIKSEHEALKTWLDSKCQAILKQLAP